MDKVSEGFSHNQRLVSQVMAFMASAIKSGEKWSEQCEHLYGRAHEALSALQWQAERVGPSTISNNTIPRSKPGISNSTTVVGQAEQEAAKPMRYLVADNSMGSEDLVHSVDGLELSPHEQVIPLYTFPHPNTLTVDGETVTAEDVRGLKAQVELLKPLARRAVWLAYVWNDHNFDDAHVCARKEAVKAGVNSFDDANIWLDETGDKDKSLAIVRAEAIDAARSNLNESYSVERERCDRKTEFARGVLGMRRRSATSKTKPTTSANPPIILEVSMSNDMQSDFEAWLIEHGRAFPYELLKKDGLENEYINATISCMWDAVKWRSRQAQDKPAPAAVPKEQPRPCPFCGNTEVERESGLDHDGTDGAFLCGCPAEPAVFYLSGDESDRRRALAAWNGSAPQPQESDDENRG